MIFRQYLRKELGVERMEIQQPRAKLAGRHVVPGPPLAGRAHAVGRSGRLRKEELAPHTPLHTPPHPGAVHLGGSTTTTTRTHQKQANKTDRPWQPKIETQR
ncbi:hypothetical protein Taro_005180 [Colocasia esculenta]|uniref:Uncharacterized protein n=1 Tax=Colocasia esculenta TaxID=4460 RepID=A0A843TPA2_COLES|nr:hypothetical protein [Colocasia esculenta]